MPVWQRFSHTQQVSAVSASGNSALVVNGEETDQFESKDLVVIDGIITVQCDTDDLCGVRLVVAHELLVTGDLTDTAPAPHDDMIYYSWFCSRGPLVFRLRSKRTIPMEHTLWSTIWKELGTTATTVNVGYHLYIHQKN